MYEIGPFRLDARAGVLTHQGEAVALGARGVAVLKTLVERPREHVSKERILDAAWPGMVVEESNLAVQVAAIRRALSRVPGGERWIETLARRGYRFVGPVRALEEDGSCVLPPRTNLGEPLTSFVGRGRERGEVRTFLAQGRLVTLVGAGGIGKTRLAQQVAMDLLPEFADGAWFIDLAPVADESLVPSAVAQALQVRAAAGKPTLDAVIAHLQGRRILLVLDNCEHVLVACAQLATALLRAATGVTLLATSREPLRVAGEQAYPLDPLTVPAPGAPLAAIAASEAVRLFVERARGWQPGFELTTALAPRVAQLCIRLDGIPLALELAAARVRSLSVDRIEALLDDRFRLLVDGSRTALPRQQTLRATLDWSHDLLGAGEREMLRRCAVFAGGFTTEAARFVAIDRSADSFAATDLLCQLAARSLLVADTEAPATRYRLLETMRAYALEKLAESGEEAKIRERHARYYRGFLEPAPHDWLRLHDREWRARYAPEIDNVRAAMDWAMDPRGDAVTAVALAGNSFALWTGFALWSEGARRLEAAADRMAKAPRPLQARLWLSLGILLDAAPDRALVAFERAIDLYTPARDEVGLAEATRRMARVLAQMGRLGQAALMLAEALPAIERMELPRPLGFYYSDLGFLTMQCGDAAAARAHYERALRLYREAGAEHSALSTLGALADATWAMGDLDGAAEALRDTVSAMRASPMARRSSLAFTLGNLAGVLAEGGRTAEALAAAHEAFPMLLETGYAWVFLDHVALIAAQAGMRHAAARISGAADAIHAEKRASRQPNEARAYERVRSMLSAAFVPADLEAALDEGRALDEAQAWALMPTALD